MQSMRERVTETRRRISSLVDDFSHISTKVLAAEKQISFWCQRADDLENRLRLSNLRIVGLPEKSGRSESWGFCGEMV